MREPCQVCVELQRAGIDAPCSICTPTSSPLTLDEVKAALKVGAKERAAAEKIRRRR